MLRPISFRLYIPRGRFLNERCDLDTRPNLTGRLEQRSVSLCIGNNGTYCAQGSNQTSKGLVEFGMIC